MARNSLKGICKLIDQANEKLSPEQSFLADLKRSIEMSADEGKRKPSQTYKPSSMKCIRNMYYQRTGAEPDEELSSYCSVGICNSGSDIHIRVQSAVEDMKKHGIDCEYIDVADFVKSRNLDYLEIVSKEGMETKLFHKTLNMSFMCDGIIRYNNHYYILEIKTEASFKWSNRTGVDPAHHKQGTAYSVAFNLPEVMFLYINRDILDMKAYRFIPTDEMKEELVGTIEECEGYVNRMICPPKPEDMPRNVCNYCSYKTKCRKDG
jgi:CRISPR/Cas system-associated exonuclease Cas4 (RecB family)